MVWGDFQPLQKYALALAVLTFWHMLSFPLLPRLKSFLFFFYSPLSLTAAQRQLLGFSLSRSLPQIFAQRSVL